jgi:intein-encoded DNA endonuclease-like protein
MVRKCRSPEERLRFYDEAMRLRGLGLGYKRIARIIWEKYDVRLNPGMIYKWISGGHHPLGRCNRIVEGSGLTYVVGAWLGDGRLAPRQEKIRILC